MDLLALSGMISQHYSGPKIMTNNIIQVIAEHQFYTTEREPKADSPCQILSRLNEY